jgi:ectoine hydroxylase-related dioxygenase (phytanoyl-CoA dioxygenase family)
MTMMSGAEVAERLAADGYTIVEGVLSGEQVAAVRSALDPLLNRTTTGRNSFLGRQTKRLFNIVGKTRALDPLACHPLVLDVLDRVLGHYLLSAPVVISIGPGESAQTLHRDESSYPVPRGAGGELVLNVMWALDDFTEANGATRIIPGSQRWPDESAAREQDTRPAVMPAGSICVFLGSVVHGGGANRTGRARLGVVMEYAAGWLRPQENLALAVPRDQARAMPEALQRLIGYGLYPPFIGYVDGRDPMELLSDK